MLKVLISLLLVTVQYSLYTEGASLKIKDECTMQNGTPGICSFLKDCPAALSNLRSGVKVEKCNPSDPRIICCSTSVRISALKCAEYTQILQGRNRPFSLLPPELEEEDSTDEEISCDVDKNPLISGGRSALIGEYPHLVALGYNVSSTPWKCGGTLISDEFVITAAHCISNPSAGKPVKVLVGDITLTSRSSSSRQLIDVAETIVFPLYIPPVTYHDIALIRLKEKVKFSRSVYPACLAQPQDDVLDKLTNKTFGTAGWGVLGVGEGQSDVLQVVNLKGYSHKRCDNMYSNNPAKIFKFPNGLEKSQICAGDSVGDKDTCKGDSGGPLWVNKEHRCVFYLVGITSFGPNFCGERFPGVYTNTLSYLDWIESVVWKGANKKS